MLILGIDERKKYGSQDRLIIHVRHQRPSQNGPGRTLLEVIIPTREVDRDKLVLAIRGLLEEFPCDES